MIKIFGLDKTNKRLSRVEKKTNEVVRDTLEKFGERVIIKAKRDHNYRSKSGNLKRSTRKRYSFKRTEKAHRMRFFLDPRITTIRKGRYAGKSYGVFQHEGTRYIRQDRFIDRAVKSELPKLRKRLRLVPRRVKRMI